MFSGTASPWCLGPLAAQYVTVANVVARMIAVLPQKGQRHLGANGSADEGQSQWVFAMLHWWRSYCCGTVSFRALAK